MSNLWQEQVKGDRDPELEEINRLALARIKGLCTNLEKRYGIHLITGVELEYYAFDKDGKIFEPGLKNLEHVERTFTG